MKRLLLILAGLGAGVAASCGAPQTAEIQTTGTTLNVTGMT